MPPLSMLWTFASGILIVPPVGVKDLFGLEIASASIIFTAGHCQMALLVSSPVLLGRCEIKVRQDRRRCPATPEDKKSGVLSLIFLFMSFMRLISFTMTDPMRSSRATWGDRRHLVAALPG